jgi:hypothetical protein
MKHLENTLETYVYSYCNMCNIPIYFFYNIDIKHLKHTFEITETFEYTLATCAFSTMSPCFLDEGGLDVGVEVGSGAWSSRRRGPLVGGRCQTKLLALPAY